MATSKKFKRAIALLLAGAMCLTLPVYAEDAAAADAELTVTAAEGDSVVDDVSSALTIGARDNYTSYFNAHSDAGYPDKEIVINAVDYTKAEAADGSEAPELEKLSEYKNESNVLAWTNQEGEVTYKFDVAETGLYNLELLYYTISGENVSIETGLKIDGNYPFLTTKNLVLDRYWTDDGAIRKDKNDNDVRPSQTEYDAWITYPVKDKEGLFNEPYFFYLEKGSHTLTFVGINMNIVLKTITFKNYDEPAAYEAPTAEQLSATPALSGEVNAAGTSTILVQAENNLYKSASTLYATSDRMYYMTSPSHPTKQRYNTIGLGTWNKSTQSVTWEYTVPADGYYKIDFKVRQNTMRGFYSNRRVSIDGVVPNKYYDDVQFPYGSDWYSQGVFDENGNEVYVYMTAGTHTLTMEAIPGTIGESMQRLDEIVYELNYYYRRILMITGPEPDEFTDYYVDIQIPDLIPAFKDIITRLYAEKETIEKLGAGSQASTLETVAIILQRCVDELDDIPSMASTVKDYISSLSAWMRDYRDQPLEMDYFEVSTVHENATPATGNFFGDLVFGFNAFIGSFFEDYNNLSDSTETSLKVWVSLGRDQALVVKELVDSDFNVNNGGVTASIDLVQGAVLEATLAGKGPEICLFLGGDFPMQLAARDLLVDLTRFSDYEDVVSSRFTDNIMTLYTYNHGVYGLPVSQTFPMMFYRTDIFEELGLDSPPETWDELIDMISIFQRSYLDVGLLSPASNLSSSVFESGDTFVMMMLQTGQNIYNDSLTATTYNTEASVNVFTKWTEFYTIYDLQQTYDAFSRFRTGEMPIVIQNYVFYNQLSVAAPEIKGLWDFTLVPGTAKEDGTISHAANSSSSGAIVFNNVSNTNAAWEFIKWFTSTEIQVEYGRTIEALLGPMGRFDTANTEALAELPWSSKDYEKIAEQMSQTVEIQIIPASYATTRHTKNAFRAVVNDQNNPRFSLSAYNRDINSEIARKNEELSVFNAE